MFVDIDTSRNITLIKDRHGYLNDIKFNGKSTGLDTAFKVEFEADVSKRHDVVKIYCYADSVNVVKEEEDD